MLSLIWLCRPLLCAAQHGCLVVNAPTANTVAAAEHGIALICALSRNVAQADASVKAGKWERSKFTGVSIVGKTLAVMGFGKVKPASSSCSITVWHSIFANGLHRFRSFWRSCSPRVRSACQGRPQRKLGRHREAQKPLPGSGPGSAG